MVFWRIAVVIVTTFFINTTRASRLESIILDQQAEWTLDNHLGFGNVSINNVQIPSYVLQTLHDRNIISDPLARFNERQFSWISLDTWSYTATFRVPSTYHHSTSTKFILLLHGVDTIASVFINNRSIGNLSNAHRRYAFDITDAIRCHSNNNNDNIISSPRSSVSSPAAQQLHTIAIHIHPAAPYAAQQSSLYGHPVPYSTQLGNTGQYNFIRKSASDFGWDWGPSFSPSGISSSITVHSVMVHDNPDNDDGDDHKQNLTPSFLLLDDALFRQTHHKNGSVSIHCTAYFYIIIIPAHASWHDDIKSGVDGDSDNTLILSIKNSKNRTVAFNQQTITVAESYHTQNNSNTKGGALLPYFEIDILATIDAQYVELWWPWDMHPHQQHLYTAILTYFYHDFVAGCYQNQEKSKKLGLRTVELVREPLQNHSETFFFRINSIPIWARGANVIPMDILETRVDAKRVERLVTDAQRANMNMLRVWGGGRYFQDSFYDTCDSLGILVWQEFMFACAMYPADHAFLSNIKEEARQQFVRLHSHPSIVIWGGNNENEAAFQWFKETKKDVALYRKEYEDLFLGVLYKEVVHAIDSDIIYADSSPSNGYDIDDGRNNDRFIPRKAWFWKKMYKIMTYLCHRLFFNGYKMYQYNGHNHHNVQLAMGRRKRWGDVTDANRGDIHYYNYSANLLKDVYPKAKFISEFGYLSFPSFFSYLSQTDTQLDWSLDSKMTAFRTRHANGIDQLIEQLKMHFPVLNKKNNSRLHFGAFLYLTQLQQALIYHTAASHWRSSKTDPSAMTYGLLYWQLNDIWAGPSWSSVNYDGSWKLLHYFALQFYNPVAAFLFLRPLDGILALHIKVVNDRPVDVKGTLIVQRIPYNAQSEKDVVQLVERRNILVSALSVDVVWQGEQPDFDKDSFFIHYFFCHGYDCTETVAVVSDEIKYARLAPSPLVVVDQVALQQQNHHSTVVVFDITLSVREGIALYVVLESPFLGVFSENAFVVFPWKKKKVYFELDGESTTTIEKFSRTLRVTWLQQQYNTL